MAQAAEAVTSGPRDLRTLAEGIAREVAARHADSVDREARFPSEAVAALKQAGLLSAYVPASLGGDGCSLRELIEMCEVIGEHCASTAMIFAMHQIEVVCLVQHGGASPWFQGYLRRVAASQRLIASVTSEVGVGGSMRTSVCAVERQHERFRLTKDATTISYGVQADDLLITARAAGDSAPGDQVLLLLQKEDYQLKRLGTWDALGMRGTCSAGGMVEGVASLEQILSTAFADIAAQTMVPVSHLLWSGCGAGSRRARWAGPRPGCAARPARHRAPPRRRRSGWRRCTPSSSRCAPR